MQSLVHPYAAQIMDLVGDERAPPGRALGLHQHLGQQLLPAGRSGSCAAALVGRAGRRRSCSRVACLAVSVVPVVVLAQPRTVDRPRRARRATSALRLRAARPALGASARSRSPRPALAVALAATPLGDVVSARLDNGKSNGVRSYLIERALAGVAESPLIGFGSTRNTHRRPQLDHRRRERRLRALRQLHRRRQRPALAAAVRARRCSARSATSASSATGCGGSAATAAPIGIAGSAAIVTSFAAMLWYNALVTPLAFMFLAYALLWRNARRGEPR